MNSYLYIFLYTVGDAKADAEIGLSVIHINIHMNEIEASKNSVHPKAKFYDFRSQYVKAIEYRSPYDTYFEIKNCNLILQRVLSIESKFKIKRIQNKTLCPVLFYFTQAYKDYFIDWIIFEKLYLINDTIKIRDENLLQKICFDLCQELMNIKVKDVSELRVLFEQIYGRRRKNKLSSKIFSEIETELKNCNFFLRKHQIKHINNDIGSSYARFDGANTSQTLEARNFSMLGMDSREDCVESPATIKSKEHNLGNINVKPGNIGKTSQMYEHINTDHKFNLRIALMKRYNKNMIDFEMVTLISVIDDHIQKEVFFITEVDNDLIISFADVKSKIIKCMKEIETFISEMKKFKSSYDVGSGDRLTINSIMPGMVVHEDILNETISIDSIDDVVDDCEMVFSFNQSGNPNFLVEHNVISTNTTSEHLDVSKQNLQDERNRVFYLGLFALKYGCLDFRNDYLNIDSHDDMVKYLTQEKLKSYTMFDSEALTEFILLCFGFDEKIINPTLNDLLDSKFMKKSA